MGVRRTPVSRRATRRFRTPVSRRATWGFRTPVSRRATWGFRTPSLDGLWALWALVPEALPPAGVSVIPAQPRLRRRAGPGGRGRRGDEADRRSGGDRAAGRPPIPSRPSPDAPAIGRGDRTMHGMAMGRTMNRMAMDGTMRAAVAHPAALHAALTNLSLQNHAIVHVRDRAHPADNFDRLGLGQSDLADRHNDDRAPDETQPLHGFFPALWAKPNPAGFALPLGLTVSGLAREFGAALVMGP